MCLVLFFSDVLLALIFTSVPFLPMFKDESKIIMDREISCRDGIRTKIDYDTKCVCKKLKPKMLQNLLFSPFWASAGSIWGNGWVS